MVTQLVKYNKIYSIPPSLWICCQHNDKCGFLRVSLSKGYIMVSYQGNETIVSLRWGNFRVEDLNSVLMFVYIIDLGMKESLVGIIS